MVGTSSMVESELESTLHDRQRRELRDIKKIDQLRARRYGMCEPGHHGRLKYTLAEQVFIWDPRRNCAITSFGKPNGSGGKIKSGTRFTDPVMLEKSEEHEAVHVLASRQRLHATILQNKENWKSHTVLVVDMSGSMRTDDIDGARCRSDGVFMCLAREFVRKQLEAQSATMYDLISVVAMREAAEVVLVCEPTDWVLYNKLVDLREWTALKPQGPGNYKPALLRAEELLNMNGLGSCAPSLFFFSDGRPSDPGSDLAATMGAMASRFGRRLTICCVGMANQQEDFSVLKEMVTEAKAFGAMASFNKPSLNADSLSQIISSHVSSLTSTKTELTELKTGKAKSVRTDIVRERVNAPDDVALTPAWRVFEAFGNEQYTHRVWSWNKEHHGEFCKLLDPRCAACFEVVVADYSFEPTLAGGTGSLCSGCKACFFCKRCTMTGRKNVHHDREKCLQAATERRNGMIRKLCIPSYNVAWKKTCFGEGAERVAFKFRFLDGDNNFIGPKMVAKESRFVEDQQQHDSSSYLRSQRHGYHKQFMRTQALASRFASIFNKALDEAASRFGAGHLHRFKTFPRIRFLEPLIFELVEVAADGRSKTTYNILVEQMLEGEYKKYNDNFGGLPKLQKTVDDTTGLEKNVVDMLLGKKARPAGESCAITENLDVIEEASEDEDEEEEDQDGGDGGWQQQFHPSSANNYHENEEYFDRLIQVDANACQRKLTPGHIPDEDFAHAFSHFSYVRSGGNLMVVDLQGELRKREDGSKEFLLTDPAIHKRGKNEHLRHLNFGRTDRGRKGMNAFFSSHKCNDACRLLGLRPREGRDETEIGTAKASHPHGGSRLRTPQFGSSPAECFRRPHTTSDVGVSASATPSSKRMFSQQVPTFRRPSFFNSIASLLYQQQSTPLDYQHQDNGLTRLSKKGSP